MNNYENQLYIFSDEVKKIKMYFGGLLLNNNNINVHQIKNNFDYDETAQKICVVTKQSKHFKLISNLVKTDEALKVIIALLFKGFSWRNEIYEEFNISSNLYIQNTLLTLQKLELITKEDGISLHPILFDSLKKAKGGQLRKQIHQAEIFFITPEFIEFCSLMKELFEFRILHSRTFRISLEKIIVHNSIFEREYKEIMQDEETLLTRKSLTDDGILYETETLKSKEMMKALREVKIELLEEKSEKGLITSNESTQLAKLKKNELATFKKRSHKPKVNKSGIAAAERRLAEQKKLDEETEKAPLKIGNISQKGKKLDKQYLKTEYKLSKDEADKYSIEQAKEDDFDEGLDFLDSLEVK